MSSADSTQTEAVTNILSYTSLDIVSATLESVEKFIMSGVDLDAQNALGDTLLHILCKSDAEQGLLKIKLLIENGANPNIVNNDGNTPVHIIGSSSHINFNVLKLLLDYNVNLHIVNNSNYCMANSLLHILINEFILADTNAEALTITSYIKSALLCGVNINSLKDFKHETVLHTLVDSIRFRTIKHFGAIRVPPELYIVKDLMRLLFEYGADIHKHDVWSFTPLHLLYVSHNINYTEETKLIRQQETLEITNLLLEYGANINITKNPSKYTLLHYVIGGDYMNYCTLFNIKILLDANININAVTFNNETALQIALQLPTRDNADRIIVKNQIFMCMKLLIKKIVCHILNSFALQTHTHTSIQKTYGVDFL